MAKKINPEYQDSKGRFKKGCKPPGRGKKPGVALARELIAKHCKGKNKKSPLEFLCDMMNDPKEKMNLRLDAAKALLPYQYGKPQQTVEANITHDIVVGLPEEDEA